MITYGFITETQPYAIAHTLLSVGERLRGNAIPVAMSTPNAQLLVSNTTVLLSEESLEKWPIPGLGP